MRYLSAFEFPSDRWEYGFIANLRSTCYGSVYPIGVLSERGLRRLEFAPITIFYGGNGSGKTTALNVIAEKLGLPRETPFNRSPFFEDYIRVCSAEIRGALPEGSRIITSDDVFDYMLNLRALNEGIDRKRENLFEEYTDAKHARFQLTSLADYERLKQVNEARRQTKSAYVRDRLMGNVREQSNGESAFFYFTNAVGENGLYLLDEPENSLSPSRQIELAEFLENSARFFGCQFVIATHSPFLLALREARVFNLDENPVAVRRWNTLPAVRETFDFFMRHRAEFEE